MNATGLDLLTRVAAWALRLAPAAALFSAFFALDGGLRWIGLFGLIPLALVLTGVPACACEARRGGASGFRSWPCY